MGLPAPARVAAGGPCCPWPVAAVVVAVAGPDPAPPGQVRERDLPVVIHTLAGEFDIYKEESGECVPVTCDDVSNGFLKPKPGE